MAKIITAIITVFILAGCASEEQAQQTALETAQARCATGGLRFVPVTVYKTPAGLASTVTVSGTCQ